MLLHSAHRQSILREAISSDLPFIDFIITYSGFGDNLEKNIFEILNQGLPRKRIFNRIIEFIVNLHHTVVQTGLRPYGHQYYKSLKTFIVKLYCGDVPKWLKGPDSKSGRSVRRRMGSNPIISVEGAVTKQTKICFCNSPAY